MVQGATGVQYRERSAEHVLGTAEVQDAFQVVRWREIEELSRLSQVDITQMRTAAQRSIDFDTPLDAAPEEWGWFFC